MVDTTRFDPDAGKNVKKRIRKAGKKAGKKAANAAKTGASQAGRAGRAIGNTAKAALNRGARGARAAASGPPPGSPQNPFVNDTTKPRGGLRRLGRGAAKLGVSSAVAAGVGDTLLDPENARSEGTIDPTIENPGFIRRGLRGTLGTLRNIGNAATFGQADRLGRGIADAIGGESFGSSGARQAAQDNSEEAVAQAAGIEASPRIGQSRVQRVSPESVLQPGAEVGQFGDPADVVQPGTGIIQNNTTGASTGLRVRPGAAAQPAAAETSQEDLPFGQRESSVRAPRSFLGALSAQNQLSRSRVRDDNRSRLGREQATAASDALAADADRALEDRKVRIQEANSASERQTALLEARSGIREALADPDQAESVKQSVLQDVIDGNDVTGEGRNILLAEIADSATVFGALKDLDFGTAFELATEGRPPFDTRDLQVDDDGNIKVGGRKITEVSNLSSQAQQALNVSLANQKRSTLRR